MKNSPRLLACTGWLAGTLLLTLTGCATYVNIPAQEGDIASNNPDADNVQSVIVPAVVAVTADQAVTGDFQVVLPPKTSAVVAIDTAKKIGPHALWKQLNPGSLPVYDVRQIRVRGWNAQVDIVRPVTPGNPDSGTQLATVWVHWAPFDGWSARHIRVWRLSVENALRVSANDTPPDQDPDRAPAQTAPNEPAPAPAPQTQP